jgi:hypothetical protein
MSIGKSKNLYILSNIFLLLSILSRMELYGIISNDLNFLPDIRLDMIDKSVRSDIYL